MTSKMKNCRFVLILAMVLLMPWNASAQRLNRKKAALAAQEVLKEWKNETAAQWRAVWDSRNLTIGGRTMPFHVQLFGSRPADGYSLYISLHGGGNAPTELNDQQWDNQKRLYRPDHAVYIAPRAPYDDWDMWFKPGLDDFYRALIQMAVAFEGVNPDKVYIMGYSAGGDGVWRMAPRMADAWAAASMMAGHPGDVRLENLRNTPFMIWCGALDSAYNRNEEDRLRGLQMDSLRQSDPQGYVHETHIVEGKAHWMERVDTVAVAWMAQYTRNPYPEKIVWRQEEVTHPSFYWLSAPESEVRRGMTVRLERKGNVVDIEQCDYPSLTLYFNDEMLNLDKPVVVRYQGQTVFKGRLNRSRSLMASTLRQRGDARYMFSASYEFRKN